MAREGRIPDAPRSDNVLGFYDKKKYVFACIKVSEAQLDKHTPVDLHPLRFSFKTGGRDGMFFPMKMTGLQDHAFDVNLYVFYHAWLNDHLSKFGYEHRGLRRKYRDWDTPACEPNAGKTWSTPERDVFLRDLAPRIPTVAALFQKLHSGERYYLTNIQALGLKPEAVRQWSDDLWLFPYYVDRKFVPYDARPGGPGSTAWPESIPSAEKTSSGVKANEGDIAAGASSPGKRLWLVGIGAGFAVIAVLGVVCGAAHGRASDVTSASSCRTTEMAIIMPSRVTYVIDKAGVILRHVFRVRCSWQNGM